MKHTYHCSCGDKECHNVILFAESTDWRDVLAEFMIMTDKGTATVLLSQSQVIDLVRVLAANASQ